jgi:hypothetical protein
LVSTARQSLARLRRPPESGGQTLRPGSARSCHLLARREQGRGQRPRRPARELAEEVQGGTLSLPARAPGRDQRRLRSRACPGPAAAPDLAQGDAEADRQLGPPVSGARPRLTREGEQVFTMCPYSVPARPPPGSGAGRRRRPGGAPERPGGPGTGAGPAAAAAAAGPRPARPVGVAAWLPRGIARCELYTRWAREGRPGLVGPPPL